VEIIAKGKQIHAETDIHTSIYDYETHAGPTYTHYIIYEKSGHRLNSFCWRLYTNPYNSKESRHL